MEKDFCEICCEDLQSGEVVYYCHCAKLYHPNCLIISLAKIGGNVNKSCSECESIYTIANYRKNNTGDSTMDKTLIGDGVSQMNASIIDTNINNLENYNEICGMAFHLSHENIAEIIKRNEASCSGNSTCNSTGEEIGRIALSPITIITTPYSGKTKKQISSNQKAEEYARLQNTHTTPNNCRHTTMSDVSISNNTSHQLHYEQSPEVSFQGIRQHLSFCSPNNINQAKTNSNNNNNFSIQLRSEKEKEMLLTTSSSNFDIDKFFKSINFEYSNSTNNTSDNQVSFRKIVFDDIEADENLNAEKEVEDSFDKENSPPLPRESSKYSHIDPEMNKNPSPVEINMEAGISHIVSDYQKIVEIPITIDFKLKDSQNLMPAFSKDYVVILNTLSLNISNIFQIFKVVSEKLGECDRVFTNIFRIEKWLTKDDCRQILYEGNFENFIQDTFFLNYSEITKLITYCVDLSFENHSNIFSVILINDIEAVSLDIDCIEELRIVASKLKESKVNLIKNLTINCILLDGKSEDKTPQNVRSVSFFYDLAMLTMGYFFAPKDATELNKSVFILLSLFDQTSLLNLKANIKGNKDPVSTLILFF